MLSWIFRNRRRLRVIYGAVPAPALAGPRFREADLRELLEEASEPSRPRPGELRRRKHHLVVRPMPRRVA
jgi:hypothetical protein